MRHSAVSGFISGIIFDSAIHLCFWPVKRFNKSKSARIFLLFVLNTLSL